MISCFKLAEEGDNDEACSRKARIDAPGAFHHIIIKGIGRRKIFREDADRVNFLDRLGASSSIHKPSVLLGH